MSENLFGRIFDSIGSPSYDLLLKTKGQIKVQWGNKYIDLVKDGNVNYPKEQIQKLIESNTSIKLELLEKELIDLINKETANRETQFTELTTKNNTESDNINNNYSILNNKVLELEQNILELKNKILELENSKNDS